MDGLPQKTTDDMHEGAGVLRGFILLAGVGAAFVAILWVRETPAVSPQPPVAMIPRAPVAEPAAVTELTAPSEAIEDPTQDVVHELPAQTDALANQLVGAWTLRKHGQRTITIEADGTATAEVRLDLVGALMYGKQLTLELTWSLEGDVLTQTIASGNPEASVSRLVRDWGDTRTYRIVEVSADQLILADIDDESNQEAWTSDTAAAAVSNEPSTATAPE